MPLKFIRNDIFKIKAEALVNPTDYNLSGAGSIDKKVHELSQNALREECDEFKHCLPGDAIATLAYNTLGKYIIHTVGPVWGKSQNAETILASCYRNSLELAGILKIKSVAIPLIASGTFGFPKDLAIKIALTEINNYLLTKPKLKVYFVIYSVDSLVISKRVTDDIVDLLGDKEVEIQQNRNSNLDYDYEDIKALDETYGTPKLSSKVELKLLEEKANKIILQTEHLGIETSISKPSSNKAKPSKKIDVDDPDYYLKIKKLADIEKINLNGISSYLIEIINKYHFKNQDVYAKAGITKMVFSNILTKNSISKKTALRLCLTLPLSVYEAEKFLTLAGYSFSPINKVDLAVKYLISKKQPKPILSNAIFMAFDISEILHEEI